LRGEPFFYAVGLPLELGSCMPDGTKRLRRGKEEIGHFFLQSSFAELTVMPEADRLMQRLVADRETRSLP
jgi:Zn-dependent alcohol dehydrogenase